MKVVDLLLKLGESAAEARETGNEPSTILFEAHAKSLVAFVGLFDPDLAKCKNKCFVEYDVGSAAWRDCVLECSKEFGEE